MVAMSKKKLERPELSIGSFKKGQILKNGGRPNFFQFFYITKLKARILTNIASFCKDFSKIGLDIDYLLPHSKKGQTILVLANSFKIAYFGRLGLLKRPNGNHASKLLFLSRRVQR